MKAKETQETSIEILREAIEDRVLHIFCASPFSSFSTQEIIEIFPPLDHGAERVLRHVVLTLFRSGCIKDTESYNNDRGNKYFDSRRFLISDQGMNRFKSIRERLTVGSFNNKKMRELPDVVAYKNHDYGEDGKRCVRCGIFRISTSKFSYDMIKFIDKKTPPCYGAAMKSIILH